ncbi:hypothetical protein KY285_033403 [Solanum tuberosum]|nr:hypothetical protein KY285_033403 [Solanum tuberosum]
MLLNFSNHPRSVRSDSRHHSSFSRAIPIAGFGDSVVPINIVNDESDPQAFMSRFQSEIAISLIAAATSKLPCTVKLISQSDFGNKWTSPYYGGHFYDGYGYAFPPPHDPGMYAAAYRSYPVYGTHRQQVVLATWLFSKIKITFSSSPSTFRNT